MDKLIEKYIHKYEGHLNHGKALCKNLQLRGLTDSCEFKKQYDVNQIWMYVIKDLCAFADNLKHDRKKK